MRSRTEFWTECSPPAHLRIRYRLQCIIFLIVYIALCFSVNYYYYYGQSDTVDYHYYDRDFSHKQQYWYKRKMKILRRADVVSIHIPKTAGTSAWLDIRSLVKRTVGPKLFVFKWENCFSELYNNAKPGAIVFTALRQPRAHVLSQYLECRYDTWGEDVTRNTAFPRNSTNFMDDFVDWVHYFSVRGEAGTRGPQNDFSCYNPIDHAARQLSCVATERMRGSLGVNHMSHHVLASSGPRTVKKATTNMRKLNFVVITELYRESLCLVEFKLRGELPVNCTCEFISNAKVSHVRHGVPQQHSVADIPAKTLEEIDAMTKKDQAVYIQGVKNFLLEIEAVEVAANRTILCSSKKTSFLQSIPNAHLLAPRR